MELPDPQGTYLCSRPRFSLTKLSPLSLHHPFQICLLFFILKVTTPVWSHQHTGLDNSTSRSPALVVS